ncbi:MULTISPECIES: GNAT family N-acetyltransferase [Pseudomonas]|uniref:Putative acetyltransferase n=1 Tax=Pseudomonas putida TaxID=303 RepID=A0A1B2F4E4_PSEPU|nr:MULTISPECIES: GNAT family N-acetyltransferase [Pseudomonas]ANY87110.1 putative acetyltransferase [Pseudomonas putida]MCL8305463.1 GNAT family N-acetyltransferase [Pseudomonas putida]
MPIRPALPRDLPLLPDVERSAAQAFTQLPGLSWLASGDVLDLTAHQAFLAQGDSWIAVDDGDRPIGFLCAQTAGSELHIHELSVHERAQGKGMGRRLLREAIDTARSRGLQAVTLTTFIDVPWNAPFYARLGFTILTPEQLDERLRGILRDERAHGLSGRCAMRLAIG